MPGDRDHEIYDYVGLVQQDLDHRCRKLENLANVLSCDCKGAVNLSALVLVDSEQGLSEVSGISGEEVFDQGLLQMFEGSQDLLYTISFLILYSHDDRAKEVRLKV